MALNGLIVLQISRVETRCGSTSSGMFSTKDTGRSPRILTFRPSRPSLCSSDCELRWHLPRIELHLGEKEKTKENAEVVSGTVLVPRAYG